LTPFLGTHRIVFFNKSQDELIRSIFFNRVNESIIVVSVTKKDDYNSLKCRTVTLELIREALDTQAEQDFKFLQEMNISTVTQNNPEEA